MKNFCHYLSKNRGVKIKPSFPTNSNIDKNNYSTYFTKNLLNYMGKNFSIPQLNYILIKASENFPDSKIGKAVNKHGIKKLQDSKEKISKYLKEKKDFKNELVFLLELCLGKNIKVLEMKKELSEINDLKRILKDFKKHKKGFPPILINDNKYLLLTKVSRGGNLTFQGYQEKKSLLKKKSKILEAIRKYYTTSIPVKKSGKIPVNGNLFLLKTTGRNNKYSKFLEDSLKQMEKERKPSKKKPLFDAGDVILFNFLDNFS